MESSAILSACERYRYQLKRVWSDGPRLLVAMLNPSTADARKNDPTITRLITRATNRGFGGIVVVNMYAFRSPYPAILEEAWMDGTSIVGPGNDQAIRESAAECEMSLVAWGNHRLAQRRDQAVLEILYEHCCVMALGLTKDRFPKHPLHIAYSVPFSPYRGRFAK